MGTSGYSLACTIFRTSFCSRSTFGSLHHIIPKNVNIHYFRRVKSVYFINTNEIYTYWAFARKLEIFTCENTLLWLHNKPHPSDQKKYLSKMVWHFIGVYIINRIVHGRLEIRNFSSRVEKIFHSLAALTRERFFNTRKEISYLHATMQYPLCIGIE